MPEVFYRGKSTYNDAEIIALMTGDDTPSRNRKVGPSAQVHFLLSNVSPVEAQQDGSDEAVCGKCALRPIRNKRCPVCKTQAGSMKKKCSECGAILQSCYVKTWRGTLRAWNNSKNKKKISPAKAAQKLNPWSVRAVRLGAFGNPSSIPPQVLNPFVSEVLNRKLSILSYEHAWLQERHRWTLAFSMASCESIAQAIMAWDRGFRTFRTLSPGEQPASMEVMCPRHVNGTLCIECKLCCGNLQPGPSVCIPTHL